MHKLLSYEIFSFSIIDCVQRFIRLRGTRKAGPVEQWEVYEITLEGPSSGNLYMDVELSAAFVHQDKSVTVPGFYDGNGIFRIRFSPDSQGTWRFQTRINVPELSEMNGEVMAVPPTGDNHGPVVPVNTHYLQYADESPYYAVGTTAYQWTSVEAVHTGGNPAKPF